MQKREIDEKREIKLGLRDVQVAAVVEEAGKWAWLQARLQGFIDEGDVLVFASTKARVDELSAQLQAAGVRHAFKFLTP